VTGVQTCALPICKQLEAALKRSYSVIGQALDMYQAQNGERLKPDDLGLHELKPILMKYLNTVKDCGFGFRDADKACIPNYNNAEKNSKVYKTFNAKSEIYLGLFDDGQFVLNDGSLVLIENGGAGNVYISVDVNGYNKKPNRLGQDLFMFNIDSKGTLLPVGVKGTTYYSATDAYCSSSSTERLNGAGCTYKALTEKDFFNHLPK